LLFTECMKHPVPRVLAFAVFVLCSPRAAHARDDFDHAEFSMGFLSGARSYTNAPFQVTDGAGARLIAQDTREPFRQATFDRVPVYGLRYDARLVLSFVRMTAGFDFPFTSFPAASRAVLGGTERTLAVDSLRPYELRFGIGVEAPSPIIVPFLDLIGGVHWTSATLIVDGDKVNYQATSFAYVLRGGVRVDLRRSFFLTASGEIGLSGDVRWGADLSVGFRTF
jgi:hypothetical protein